MRKKLCEKQKENQAFIEEEEEDHHDRFLYWFPTMCRCDPQGQVPSWSCPTELLSLDSLPAIQIHLGNWENRNLNHMP